MRRRKNRQTEFASAPPPKPTRRPPPAAGTGRGTSAFWLWGRHAVLAAVANPRRRLDRLVGLDEHLHILETAAAAAPRPVPGVDCLDRRVLAALLPQDAVHQGLAALVRPLPAIDLEDVAGLGGHENDDGLLLVVLDQVTDPRNVGAVLRSARAFGAAAVVVQDRHAPEESGTLAKAASGALEAIPMIRVTNLARTLRDLQQQGVSCIGLAGDAELPLDRHRAAGRLALVLGAEGDGLRRLVRETCDVLVRIPIAAGADSLNLSAAAAIALYACACHRGPGQDVP